MKKATALLVIVLFLIFNTAYISQVSAADMVTEKISSVSKAKEIAANAKGGYWEGAVAPGHLETEVALPVIDSEGNTVGHIVADKAKLISALNELGYTKVASALTAAQVGTTTGLSVGAGLSMGTVGVIAGGAAVVGGGALALGGGGGGGGTTTTTSHH